MNLTYIFITIFISTISIYIFFLFLGKAGINKNRIAQGLDKKVKEY